MPKSAEFGLLLEACADPPDLTRLKLSCLQLHGEQWPTLLSLADAHGVTSLLHLALAQISGLAVPADFVGALEKGYSSNVHKSLLQARELSRVLDALDTTGITVIPYKGLLLSELAYGDLAIRQAGDIDLLVRKQDLSRAKAVVEKLGFSACLDLTETELDRYLAVGYELTFDYGNHRNLLELKWGIVPRFYSADFDMEAMFAARTQLGFAGRRVNTLALEDLFLVLCMHAAKHCWSRLIWLCDISRLLTRPSLDWPAVCQKAKELGISRIVGVTIGLVNQMLGMESPATPTGFHGNDLDTEMLTREVREHIVSGKSPNPESLAYFQLMIRLRERTSDRIRFALRLAFTPGPNEWKAVKLWGYMAPLYRVVRMARLGARIGRMGSLRR